MVDGEEMERLSGVSVKSRVVAVGPQSKTDKAHNQMEQ